MKDINEIGQLALWSAYCDKKQECEVLKDKLKECFEMLHYSHFTCEQWYDYEKVSKCIKEMETFLNAANK